MITYAYQIQVRETEDTEWMDADMMVSPPGHAPHTLLNVVKEGHENLVRITRIKLCPEFLFKLERNSNMFCYKSEEDVELTFTDRVLSIPKEMLQ